MATWTTGVETYVVTEKQKEMLDTLRDEYIFLCDERLKSLRHIPCYDGHHIGSAPNPFEDLGEEYLVKVREILGPNPECMVTDT